MSSVLFKYLQDGWWCEDDDGDDDGDDILYTGTNDTLILKIMKKLFIN